MCCMVLKCIECTVGAMWMWWSCNACILQYLCCNSAKNGNENIKIYYTLTCSGGGLVMTKMCEFMIILMRKCDS